MVRKVSSHGSPSEADKCSVAVSAGGVIYVRFHDTSGQVFAFCKLKTSGAVILADEILNRIDTANGEYAMEGGHA